MKCIWKITKIIPQLIQDNALNVESLLFDVNKFLVSYPPNEWKKRAAENLIPQPDMPLRTIKTILHELAGVYDERVFEHVALISDVNSSHAVQYLKQMVESKRKKAGIVAPIPFFTNQNRTLGGMVTHQEGGLLGNLNSPGVKSVSTRKLSESEIRSQLSVIFEKIRNKDFTKQGIFDLFNFKNENPETDIFIDEFVNTTSSYFQGYIRRGLLTLVEAEEAKKSRPVSMFGIIYLI